MNDRIRRTSDRKINQTINSMPSGVISTGNSGDCSCIWIKVCDASSATQANATTNNPTSTAPIQNTARNFQSSQDPS